MNESGVKQQIVDTIQGADTILVTVSTDPSVDELSAALGLTVYLNDLGKHATAVVSGALPPAINFLEPEKTFEPTIDSLRDFVIALDKDKADHLRYKVEGDVVKIFITPYKTVITNKDLDFSQGDYNVEMVIALGVTDQDHLDKALAAHGKIFHDASVATIGLEASTLGTIDWTDETASSLSELVTSLTDGLQDAEHPISSQVASSLLTGIVAATDRFSNDKTSAQTMSLAGELMAAGANQQLIASKLREGTKLPLQDDGKKRAIPKPTGEKPATDTQPKRRDGGLSIAHAKDESDESVKASEAPKQKPDSRREEDTKPAVKADSLVTLEEALKKSEASRNAEADKQSDDLVASVTQEASANKTPEDMLSEQLASVVPPVAPPQVIDQLTEEAGPEITATKSALDTRNNPAEPSLGGTLNATTDQAAQDKRNADTDRNKTILSHGSNQYVGDSQPIFGSPLNGSGQTGEQPSIDPFATINTLETVAPLAPPTPKGTLADIDQQNRADQAFAASAPSSGDAAMDAVNAALDASPNPQPFDPVAVVETAPLAPAPQVDNQSIPSAPMTPPPPPMPDFSMLPPLPPPPVFPQSEQFAPVAPSLPPLGPQPPEMPLAPLPPEQLGSVLPEAPDLPPVQDAGPIDPKQFRIPGQQQ